MYWKHTKIFPAPIQNKLTHKPNAQESTGEIPQLLYSLSKKLVKVLMFVIPFFKTDNRLCIFIRAVTPFQSSMMFTIILSEENHKFLTTTFKKVIHVRNKASGILFDGYH